MKKALFIFLLILPMLAYASGPSMPAGYRNPNEEELSLIAHDSDKYRYSIAAGDFNGDGLVDGALLAIAENKRELALFVFLNTNNDQIYKWYKLASLNYEAVQYTGLKVVKPQVVSYYRNERDKMKSKIKLTHDAFELFQFEGSSSIILL